MAFNVASLLLQDILSQNYESSVSSVIGTPSAFTPTQPVSTISIEDMDHSILLQSEHESLVVATIDQGGRPSRSPMTNNTSNNTTRYSTQIFTEPTAAWLSNILNRTNAANTVAQSGKMIGIV